jgi:hypothetical protein
MKYPNFSILLFATILISCSKDEEAETPVSCSSDQLIDQSRGECSENLTDVSEYVEEISGTIRKITTNNIPDHSVGLFGNVPGSLNPNTIEAQSSVYEITTIPQVASGITRLLSTTGVGPEAGPKYSFGILFNGVELDPVAAEPWPHTTRMGPSVNWEWNLEATYVQIGLDCNSAHVQPTGKYHYHGPPTPFLESLGFTSDKMTMIGYAADGFPVYYKYGYTTAGDSLSGIIALSSSYKLKTGIRPGDGITAPCDVYTGVYSNDWLYVNGWGVLDECNGRTGVTPEYPDGTYYYVLTDEFPSIPRCFKGTPSQDFKIGM